jgi:hypothetical protein
MAVQGNGASEPRADRRATFTLERFAWRAPDRLQVAGTFHGLPTIPREPPVLIVRGERLHRLPAVANSLSGPPEDGRPWRALFAWQEAPTAFEAAALEFGDEFAVELPTDGDEDAGPRVLRVLRAARAGDAEGDPALATPSEALKRLHLEADLLLTGEAIRELRGTLAASEAARSRLEADLQVEREARAAEAARFSDGLDRVRRLAEEAVASEQREAQQAAQELAAAEQEARAEADRLRDRLAAAQAEREQDAAARREERERADQALEAAHAEAAAERERSQQVLEAAHAEAAAERERSAQALEAAHAEVAAERERAAQALEAARADSQRALDRLNAIKRALGEES